MAYDPDMKLSANFALWEASKSTTADRLGINNHPPERIIPAIQAVAENVLQPCRDYFGVPISPESWFRSQALDKAIRSPAAQARWTPKSQHIYGQAVDFEVPGVSNMELAEWIARNLTFDQMILEFYQPGIPHSGWVHVSWVDEARNRGEMLQFHPGTGFRFLSLE